MKLLDEKDHDAGIDEVEAYRMPLLDHLRELRTRLIRGGVALGLGMCASFVLAEPIYAWLTAPFQEALASAGVEGGLSLVQSPFEGITTYLRVAFVGGAVFASPVMAWQLWQFIAPGLYKTERRVVGPLAVSSTVLFMVGGAFAYYVIFPVAFPFFLQVLDANASLSVAGYVSAVVKMMMAFGLCFQLPVVTWFLARMGLIDHHDMIASFRYAVVAIFLVSALITPPEVLTQILLAVPLVALYGIGIGIAWLSSTKQRG